MPSLRLARDLVLSGACILVSACSTTAPSTGEPQDTVTMEVFSLPKGCVVEMNGEYVGAAPVKIDIPSTSDGRWQGRPGMSHAITVSTPSNRASETRKYRSGDPIPRRLMFRPAYAHLYQ